MDGGASGILACMAKTRSNSRKTKASPDDLDPRLVELARYLARRAAERDYEALRQRHDQPGNAPARRKEAT
ncbi:MAG: hypothetical protein HWD60_01365 [Defluviicoccus sp.]|nr:MAG: hypothetical protein HWD60_01365 [Defluviicoccus sp.]